MAVLGLGAILLFWLAYNLLIERQAEFQLTFAGLGFLSGLGFVGHKWITEGREQMRMAKRRKRKRNRSRERNA